MSLLFLLKGEANAAPAWPFPVLFQCWGMALSQKPLPSMLVAQQLVGSERSAGSLKVHGSSCAVALPALWHLWLFCVAGAEVRSCGREETLLSPATL